MSYNQDNLKNSTTQNQQNQGSQREATMLERIKVTCTVIGTILHVITVGITVADHLNQPQPESQPKLIVQSEAQPNPSQFAADRRM